MRNLCQGLCNMCQGLFPKLIFYQCSTSQGLFPITSILNHACTANTICYAKEDFTFVCRAITDIKKGRLTLIIKACFLECKATVCGIPMSHKWGPAVSHRGKGLTLWTLNSGTSHDSLYCTVHWVQYIIVEMFSDIISNKPPGQLHHPPFPPVSYSKHWETKPSLLAICKFLKNDYSLRNPVCFAKFVQQNT